MRYYYSKLSEANKKIYKEIYYAIENLKPSVTVKYLKKIKNDVDIFDIYRYVINDNPLLFYVNPYSCSLSYTLFNCVILFSYLHNKKEIDVIKSKIDCELVEIDKKILSYKTAIERERAIHKYIMSEVEYDYESNSSNDLICHTIVGSILRKKAVCDGISRLFKLLCDRARINSLIIVGKGWNQYDQPQPHAWNMIKLGPDWYHIDMTWDLTLSKRFKYVRYDYFNLRYDEIKRDHCDFEILEKCDSLKNNYFYENKCIVRGVTQLENFLEKKLSLIKNNDKKKNYITIKFYRDNDEEDVQALIFSSVSKAMNKSGCRNIRYSLWPNKTQDVYLLEINKI